MPAYQYDNGLSPESLQEIQSLWRNEEADDESSDSEKKLHEDLNIRKKMPAMLMRVIWHPLITFLFHLRVSTILFGSASNTSDR